MGILRSTFSVGSLTLVSRVMGFMRDLVIARVFGASVGTDAFVVAFRIPNLLRRFVGEGSFAMAFVPVLARSRERDDRAELKSFVDDMAGTLAAVLTLLTATGIFAAPWLVRVFAPGWAADSEATDLASRLLRLTFPYIFFIALTAFTGSILNTWRRFAVPALSPVLLNIALIGAALLLAPRLELPIMALGWGVLMAGIVQLAFQLPILNALGLLPRPRWGWRNSRVRRVLVLMVPTLVGASVAQLNVLVDTMVASFLGDRVVTWLFFADRLVEFPMGVFAIALSTVILPALSARVARNDTAGFRAELDQAIRLAVVVAMPAALGLLILARPILMSLFGYGAFSGHDVSMSAVALSGYALALPAYMAIKVLAPGFYAQQDTRTPVRFAIIALLSNALLNVAFVLFLKRYTSIPPHAGLALASAVSASINAGLLYWGLGVKLGFARQPGWGKLSLRVLVACITLAGFLLWSSGPLSIAMQTPALARVGQLVWLVGGGAVVYVLTLLCVGWRPSQHRIRATGGAPL